MLRSRAFTYFLLFGISLTILSIPFLTGVMRPIFDTHNPYTVIYGFLNLPITFTFKGFISYLAHLYWDAPTESDLDLISVLVSIVFWAVMGFVLGMFADEKYGRKG